MEDKIIKIKGHEYKMSFPTVGQYYEIETQKQFLGRGYYNTLLGNRTQAAADALDMIDIEATLTVMLPELHRKWLKIPQHQCRSFRPR